MGLPMGLPITHGSHGIPHGGNLIPWFIPWGYLYPWDYPWDHPRAASDYRLPVHDFLHPLEGLEVLVDPNPELELVLLIGERAAEGGRWKVGGAREVGE